jgi:uncharacterized protein YaaN involved in tellurite resistance
MTEQQTTTPSPTLTLTPILDATPELEGIVVDAQVVDSSGKTAEAITEIDDTVLSPEELKMVDEFAKSIDVRDSATILQYGAGTQKKMADFSEDALARVRTKDLGETGELISNVVLELKNFNTEDEKGLFGFFKKAGNKIETLRARYDKAEANIEKIVKQLKDHQIQLMKDSAMLDKMYDLNLSYFKELTMYIMAGKKRLAEIREGELAELIAKADASGRAEDAQARPQWSRKSKLHLLIRFRFGKVRWCLRLELRTPRRQCRRKPLLQI